MLYEILIFIIYTIIFIVNIKYRYLKITNKYFITCVNLQWKNIYSVNLATPNYNKPYRGLVPIVLVYLLFIIYRVFEKYGNVY